MKAVIVGAGVAGLSIGWRLRQAGMDVTILERAQPGRGATWASAGMIAATAEIGSGDSPVAEFARQSSALWPVFAAEIEQATKVAIHYGQSGALILARTPEEADALRARARMDNLVSWVEPGDAQLLEPLVPSDSGGALLAAGEAQVDTRALGRALTAAFVKAGGSLQASEPMVLLETENGRAIAARTPYRTYEADVFIVAAGAWSGELIGLPRELATVKPVKGEMIALTAPAGSALPRHLIWGNGIYMVPRQNRLLIGATEAEAGFDTRVTEKARNWLRGRANTLLPSLKSWEEVEHWSGLRPGSPDGLPLLGPTTIEGLYAATGQYRNGILFAPAIAEAVSRLVLEQKVPPEIVSFDPRRFA
jgi:glycine oxidase